MRSIRNIAQHQPLLGAGARFLAVWLASALLTWIAFRVLAWSGVVISEDVELILVIQPTLASILMAWWRWSPAEAPDDVMIAIGKGMGAAVLVVWATVAATTYHTMFPPPDALPFSVWSLIVPPLVFSIFALITGFVGALIGAQLAKHLHGNQRQRRHGSGSVS